MLVIIDAKPKDLGLPTDAYVAVEEVHDVRCHIYLFSFVLTASHCYIVSIKFCSSLFLCASFE